MLAQSEPPGEEKKVGVLKCCSRFVSFHLLCNESCYCCEKQRDLTGEFKVKPQGEREKEQRKNEEREGDGKRRDTKEKKGKNTQVNRPSLEKV